MSDGNRNAPFFYRPVQQPMFYQSQQNVPYMNYSFNRPYQEIQMPMQQNLFQMPSAYQVQQQIPQPMQQQMLQQPTFYPPNRPLAQQLGGMGPSFPYPKQTQGQKSTSQIPNIFSQFKSADGNYDINKMINTAGTAVNTMNQITGLIKQMGGFFTK